MSRATRWLPGLGLAAAGAAAAWGIHALVPGIPWLTAALVLGVIVGCIPPLRPALDGVLKPGLAASSRHLLRIGIVLLGLKLSLQQIAQLGWLAILGIVALVAASFAITYGIARLLRLPGDEPVLMAAGFSICGVSAIGAMSAARGPRGRVAVGDGAGAGESAADDTGTPTALVTLYGTLAIVILPALSGLLGLGALDFGQWTGASVHDVGQVVATAQLGGSVALAAAVVVKLTRVLMLAPVVAIASLDTRRREARGTIPGGPATASASVGTTSAETDAIDATATSEADVARPKPPIVPLFIVGFAVAVLVRSFVPLPDAVLATADVVQSALLATALFAIGAGLRLEKLVRSGPRALAAGAIAWTVILAMALGFAVLV